VDSNLRPADYEETGPASIDAGRKLPPCIGAGQPGSTGIGQDRPGQGGTGRMFPFCSHRRSGSRLTKPREVTVVRGLLAATKKITAVDTAEQQRETMV
jgi:hypothetical protein